jgi:uncharacterized protein (DUF697 family)
MPSTKQMVHGIIQAASSACADIEGSMANAPDSEFAAIAPIQTDMIIAIASVHGIEIPHAEAADLQLKFSATSRGGLSTLSHQAMVGWLPGVNAADNGSMSSALTEAIGWSANNHFEQIAANMRTE